MTDIRVPTLGESVTEATVATWFKKVGDAVKVDEMLCELETDKVTVEVPATAAGVLTEIVAKEGETVGVDALLATIDEKAGAQARRRLPRRRPRKPRAAGRGEPGQAAGTDAESAPANEQSIEIMVPTLGESVTEATVSTWFKKVGDQVTQDEMLCELETDKVSVEVPAPASGRARRDLRRGRRHRAGRRQARPHRRRRRRRRGRRRAAAPPPTPAEAPVSTSRARRRGRALGEQADGRPRHLDPDQVAAPAATAGS